MELKFKVVTQFLLKAAYNFESEDVVYQTSETANMPLYSKIGKKEISNDLSVHLGVAFSEKKELIKIKIIMEVGQFSKEESISKLKIETINIIDITEEKIETQEKIEEYLQNNIDTISKGIMPFSQRIANYLLDKSQLKFTIPRKFKLVPDDEFCE